MEKANIDAMAAGAGVRAGAAEEAGYWLALKRAWDAGEEGLEAGVESYFRRLSHAYFERALGGDRGLAGYGYEAPAAVEVWAVVRRELVVKRVASGMRLLDDVFLRAFARARASGAGTGAVEVLGFLKKQFEMRVRDVVRVWVREQFGSPGERQAKRSLDEVAAGAEDDGDGRSLHELVAEEREMDEAEWRDLQGCGEGLAERWFATADATTRACVVLKAGRVSLAHPVVGRVLGQGKTFLFQCERRARESAVEMARGFDAELDGAGVAVLAAAMYRSMRERCESWFFAENRLGALFSLLDSPQPKTRI